MLSEGQIGPLSVALLLVFASGPLACPRAKRRKGAMAVGICLNSGRLKPAQAGGREQCRPLALPTLLQKRLQPSVAIGGGHATLDGRKDVVGEPHSDVLSIAVREKLEDIAAASRCAYDLAGDSRHVGCEGRHARAEASHVSLQPLRRQLPATEELYQSSRDRLLAPSRDGIADASRR